MTAHRQIVACAALAAAALAMGTAAVGHRGEAASEPQAPQGCYAFRRQGRLWVSCGGTSQPVSHHAYWEQIAVSPKGDYLAARGGTWALEDSGNAASRHALVIDLSNGSIVERKAPGVLFVPTCGTIESAGTTATDLITSEPLEMGQSADIVACSNDRSVANTRRAAWPRGAGKAQFYPVNPLYEISRAPFYHLAPDVLEYAVSPSGSYLAYTTGEKLCVQRFPLGSPLCQLSVGGPGVLGTILDDGAVLLNVDANDPVPCGYHGAVQVQKAPFPRGWHGDACPGVFYWRPGLPKAVQLQDMADEAQWITPDAAKALIAGYKANRWPRF